LKNLCVSAAYQPIREFLDNEKREIGEPVAERITEEVNHFEMGGNQEKASPELRTLTIKDFKKAKNEISASVSEDAFSVAELRKWNETYGEGGNRSKSTLSYYM